MVLYIAVSAILVTMHIESLEMRLWVNMTKKEKILVFKLICNLLSMMQIVLQNSNLEKIL